MSPSAQLSRKARAASRTSSSALPEHALRTGRATRRAVARTGVRRVRTATGCQNRAAASEQHTGVLTDLPESDAAIGGTGRAVEVVDVEADDGRDGAAGVLDDRSGPGGPDPAAAVGRRDPDTL